VVEDHPPDHGEDHLTVGECQHGINAPLGAGVPQLGEVTGLAFGVLQSSGNSLGGGGPSTPLIMEAPALRAQGDPLRRLILTV